MSNALIESTRTRKAVGAVTATGLALGGLVLMAPPAEAQQTVFGQSCDVVLNLDILTAQGGWTSPGNTNAAGDPFPIWNAAGVAGATGSGYHPPVPGWPTASSTTAPGQVICVAGGAFCAAGGAGGAHIIASDLADTVWGSACDDLIEGNKGNDVVFSLGGNDTLRGDAGADSLNGGNGEDFLLGGAGNDTLHGNDGDDTLQGQGGKDNLNGENGNDCLLGQGGNDELYGWNGRDILFGGDGNDYGAGNDGADFVAGGFGMDTLRGNDGADIVRGDSAGTFNTMTGNCVSIANVSQLLDANGNPFPAGTNPTNSSDETWNTGFVDWPIGASTGTYFNDDIRGGDGDDRLSGEAGSDTIHGDRGDDTIFGEGTTAFAESELRYYSAAGNDSLSGNDGDDSIEGGNGNDNLMGGADDDHLIGGSDAINTAGLPAGTDRLNGGSEWDACEPNTGFVDMCEIVI